MENDSLDDIKSMLARQFPDAHPEWISNRAKIVHSAIRNDEVINTSIHGASELRRKHFTQCRFNISATCAVAIECKHGYDVCTECDPCTCNVIATGIAIHAIRHVNQSIDKLVDNLQRFDWTKTV